MSKTIGTFFAKAKEKSLKLYESVKKNALALVASATAILPATSCITVAADVNTDELVGKVLVMVFDIFKYIGILLLAWSIGMLVLAFKNEDADSKSRAMMMMVVAVMLLGIKPIFNGLGLITLS